MTDVQIVLLVLPLAIVEIGLIVFALRDLFRPERRVKGDSKPMWGFIIILLGFVGPILYFVIGREPD